MKKLNIAYTTDKNRFTLGSRLKAYGMIALMMVQVWMPASAAVLQSNVIQEEFNNNPEFQRVLNQLLHQFSAPQYSDQNAPLGAKNIASFYEDLVAQSPQTVEGANATSAKYVGTPIVQARYIRSQIQALLGRQLVNADNADYANEAAQLNTLYTNTLAYVNDNPGLVYGQTLSIDQENNGYGLDFVWPELRNINGEDVLVPIVYFSEATFRARRVSDHDVQFNGTATFDDLNIDSANVKFGREAYLNVVNDLVNNQGGVYSDGDLQVVAGGTLQNISGAIDAAGDLKIAAHSIDNQTLVHRWDYGDTTGGSFGEVASISAGGDVTLRSQSNIVLRGANVNAGDEITFAADGTIYIGTVALSSSFEGNVHGWQTTTSSVDYLGSSLSAENTIKLIANGEILIDGSELLSSQGHIDLLAGMGISIEDEQNSFQSHRKGKFGKTSKEETAYKTVAMRSILDAGKGLRLHTELGDLTLKGVDISSVDGTHVSASNGAVNMLMAVETDHYSYNSITKKLFTIKTVNRGHKIETAVPNTIIGGFQAEALYGLNVQYEGDPTLSLDEQVTVLSSNIEGLSWMADLRNPQVFPELENVRWEDVDLVYEEWNKSNTTLSPAALAVIMVVVTIVTMGAGAAVAGAVTGSAYAGTTAAVLNAGFTAMVSTAAVASANTAVNGGSFADIHEAAFRAVVSDDGLKSMAVAMVTAGAISAIDAQFFSPSATEVEATISSVERLGGKAADIKAAVDNLHQLSLAKQALQAVTNATVKAGVSATIEGGSFQDRFTTSLLQTGIDRLGQSMANGINGAAAQNNFGLAFEYIAHAAAGCVTGGLTNTLNEGQSSSEGCSSGALGSVASQITTDVYEARNKDVVADYLRREGEYIDSLYWDDQLSERQIYYRTSGQANHYRTKLGDLSRLGVDLGKLSAALSAFVAGLDVNIASDVGSRVASSNLRNMAVPLIQALKNAAERDRIFGAPKLDTSSFSGALQEELDAKLLAEAALLDIKLYKNADGAIVVAYEDGYRLIESNELLELLNEAALEEYELIAKTEQRLESAERESEEFKERVRQIFLEGQLIGALWVAGEGGDSNPSDPEYGGPTIDIRNLSNPDELATFIDESVLVVADTISGGTLRAALGWLGIETATPIVDENAALLYVALQQEFEDKGIDPAALDTAVKAAQFIIEVKNVRDDVKDIADLSRQAREIVSRIADKKRDGFEAGEVEEIIEDYPVSIENVDLDAPDFDAEVVEMQEMLRQVAAQEARDLKDRLSTKQVSKRMAVSAVAVPGHETILKTFSNIKPKDAFRFDGVSRIGDTAEYRIDDVDGYIDALKNYYRDSASIEMNSRMEDSIRNFIGESGSQIFSTSTVGGKGGNLPGMHAEVLAANDIMNQLGDKFENLTTRIQVVTVHLDGDVGSDFPACSHCNGILSSDVFEIVTGRADGSPN